MLCMSTLRFLSPVEKNIVSNSLDSYNSLVDKLPEDETLAASVKKNTDSLNEQGYCELGKIFTFLVLETILLSRLMNINPFDQPAVEQVKIETKKILR